jgi:hypothetical protein
VLGGTISGVPPRRRTDPEAGLAAVRTWTAQPGAASRDTVKVAVRFTLEELAERAPGHTTEVRVPPYGVTQCMEGPRHTRGTPPNVVETDPATWLALATGRESWTAALGDGRVHASGERADLSALLPIVVAGTGG